MVHNVAPGTRVQRVWQRAARLASGASLVLLLAAGLAAVIAPAGKGLAAVAYGYGPMGIGWISTYAVVLALIGLATPGRRWRRAASATVVLMLAVLLLVVFPPRWMLRVANSPHALLYAQTGQKVVALTIDDAIDPRTTPAILRQLAEHEVHATFFVLSDTARGNQPILQRLVRQGHEVGNHQTSEVYGWRMSPDAWEADITEAGERLSEYATIRWVRPGGGLTTRSMSRAAERRRWRVVLGSVFPWDSHVPSVRFAAAYICNRVFPGAIIVLHDAGPRGGRTARVLDHVLPELKRQGYRVVALHQLLESQTSVPSQPLGNPATRVGFNPTHSTIGSRPCYD